MFSAKVYLIEAKQSIKVYSLKLSYFMIAEHKKWTPGIICYKSSYEIY